jgi:hypothetical protein
MRRCVQVLLAAMLAVGALLQAGCATGANRDDTDIPWNTPQPWEGAPFIPGLEGR